MKIRQDKDLKRMVRQLEKENLNPTIRDYFRVITAWKKDAIKRDREAERRSPSVRIGYH